MKVRDVMSINPKLIQREKTIQEAAVVMRDSNIGTLLVQDDKGLIGVVSDRDLTIRSIAEGKDPKQTMIKDVMSEGVVYCSENDTLEQAAWKMEDNHIRRLAVLNGENQLVGVVSVDDLAVRGGDEIRTGEVIHKVNENVISETRM